MRENNPDIVQFNIEFKAVGNCDKLSLIQQHGVKSILLDASAYQLSRNDCIKIAVQPLLKH
ncbi:hypothetical protein BN1095_6560001 [Clostridioides difficile]|uniref:Uncharacterized protein n=1 Tax=Clostridioides difficile TaxID=1496 RepID=A0A069AYJ8_CLODI|nr:hypothetical protein BN1095_6560001 [Clostridioides difficile]